MARRAKTQKAATQRREHRNVAVLAYDGLGAFELGTVVEIFGLARPEYPGWYRLKVCGLARSGVRATGGLQIGVQGSLESLSRAGTIIIPGWPTDTEPPANLIRILRRAHARGARLVSICSGAFVIAATGLLDGRRATTHWRYAEKLAKKYPKLTIEPDVLYVDEGDILTSAGSAAGIDLCLHIVRKDFGADIANQVARRLVFYPQRDGGQAQFVDKAVTQEENPWLAKLLTWTQEHLEEDLPVQRLARQAGMSKRTLARRFAERAGTSPIDWVIGLRVARARQLLEVTTLNIDEIASQCGFGSAPTLRHHFRERLKTSPASYRAHFRVKNARASGCGAA